MDISFIIPAYNAENSIEATLESICALSLPTSSFEIIVVDDASMDNTVQVIEEYRERFRISNMILLQQAKNQRQGAARNRGLSVAKGKYVAFVDADDLVAPGLTKVLDMALTTNVDIMHCGMILQRNNLEQIVVSCAPKNEILTIHEFLENWHTVETCQSPCACLYKNKLLKNILFVEGKRLEDTDWVEKNLYAAKSIMCIDDIIYIYKENVNSTMHTTKYDTCADWWHFSYRRYLFANTIKDNMPQYAERLMEAAKYGVIANTTFRRLTRFSSMDYWRIRKRCGTDCMTYLSSMRWTGFTKIALCYPTIAFFCLLLSCPIAKYSRLAIHTLRNLIK